MQITYPIYITILNPSERKCCCVYEIKIFLWNNRMHSCIIQYVVQRVCHAITTILVSQIYLKKHNLVQVRHKTVNSWNVFKFCSCKIMFVYVASSRLASSRAVPARWWPGLPWWWLSVKDPTTSHSSKTRLGSSISQSKNQLREMSIHSRIRSECWPYKVRNNSGRCLFTLGLGQSVDLTKWEPI